MKKKGLKLSQHQEIEQFINHIKYHSGRIEEFLQERFGSDSFPCKFLEQLVHFNGRLEERMVHACKEDEESLKKKPSKEDALSWSEMYGQLKEQYREDSGN